nr:hypothetical protein [Tanacetum cinerariifolium]
MVDFVEASPLRYALTFKPTVYVSHIRQFWSTARIETTEEGTKILATVDGILRTVTESSFRRNLKLQDEEGISSLPDTELFENLTLMGYKISPNQKFTFQRGFNEFSSNIATTLVCLATNNTYNFSKMILDGLVKNVNNKVSKFLMYPRFLTMCLRMSQFGQITHTHAYEVPFHTRKLFTTLRVNSPSFSERIVPLFATMLVPQGEGSSTPTEPHHTPSFEAQLPSHTTHSSPTIPSVSTVFIPPITSSDTPPIRQYNRRTRIAQSSVLPPVADKPASSLRDVSQREAFPTDSGFLANLDRATIAKSSTLPHDSAPRVTSYAAAEGTQELEITRLKARVKLLEDREGVTAEGSGDDAPIKGRNLDEGEAAAKRVSDDTKEMAIVLTSMDAATVLASRAAEVPTGSGSIPTASPPAAEVPTDSDVVPTASPVFAIATVVTPYRRRKGKEVTVESKTLKKQKVQKQIDAQSVIDGLDRSNETVAKYLQEYQQFASELPLERRIKLISDLVRYQENYAKVYKFQTQQRKPWSNKQKRDYYMAVIRSNLGWKAERLKRKGLSLVQKSAKKFKPSDEVPEEVKSPDEVHTEGQKSYWKIIRLGGSSASYQFFVDLLKHMDKEDLKQLRALVKESISNRPPTIEWKLYDMCGVHQVTSKDKEIFMLVEKDYPIKKGLALVMISYKLQVENYSQMANDLVLKIYKIANSPRQQGD